MSDTVSEELSPLPAYFQYVGPVIEVQRELGGSAKPDKVRELVLDKLKQSSKPCSPRAARSPARFENEMQKVRQVLMHTGFIDASRKGVWTLTEKGLSADLSDIDLHHLNAIRKKVEKAYRNKRKHALQGKAAPAKKEIPVRHDDRKALSRQIQAISADGLERVCQELLRKSGFEGVDITGRIGEECFEGRCIFQENPLMRTVVLFRFKCRQEVIEAEEITGFRKAMMGRADKGILMTTGTFSLDAKRDARKDGAAPVVLVDGNQFMGMVGKLAIRTEGA